MEAIVAILRAAHCKSTHHYFAIDSLWEVTTDRGRSLANMLLANYGPYLKGAKDPDNVFKDFENHVVHVADGYWGGAAKASQKWLDSTLGFLNAGQWSEAAYALGVLSHYFSDPFCPLHTAQSPRETALHRPLEWSVCCAYQEIYKLACNDSRLESFGLPSGPAWLKDSVHQGATLAHQHYETLLDDYNINESRKNPALALGTDSKRILAQIFTWVLTAWGSVIDRIAEEIGTAIPSHSLTLPTLMAGVQVPTKKIVQSIEAGSQRKEVEEILDEYQRTGKVVRNLTPEQKTVQTIRIEKPNYRPPTADVQRVVAEMAAKRDAANPKAVAKLELSNVKPVNTEVAMKPNPFVKNDRIDPAIDKQVDAPKLVSPLPKTPTRTEPALPAKRTTDAPQRREQVCLASPIVDAPAIGPKTAARFHAIDCNTIGEFLERDATELAAEIGVNWITAKLVADWQSQARLACQIERLSAAGAGLLVLAGLQNAEQLIGQDATSLHSHLEKLAQTTEGKRLLRDNGPPPLKTVQRWIAAAETLESAGANKVSTDSQTSCLSE